MQAIFGKNVEMVEHNFGGSWTEEKLDALRRYLIAYRTIFTSNPAASKLKTVYIDAFAGTGNRTQRADTSPLQVDALDDAAAIRSIKQGSARIALQLPSPFDEYVFIDRKEAHAQRLRSVIASDYPHLQRASCRCK